MIDLTVKTLDSQNHSFSVEDDITVADFKIQIAETVNISADTQRLIYCGRVLQDESKLGDYNVNGKVVHLVQRAPPSANSSDGRPRSPSPQPAHQRRVLGGFEGGNAMYLGSMAFPTNLLGTQGFVSPPPPTHSLAGSRLNVARRMLRRADAIINLLENPSARPNEQPPPEDQQEEVTPIIEARVIVPTSLGGGGGGGSNENGNGAGGPLMDEQMVMSAVQDSLFGATNDLTMSAEAEVEGAIDNQPGTAEASSTERSPPSTPAEEGIETEDAAASAAAAAPSSSGTSGAEQRNGTRTGSRNIADNASRTSEMAELLAMLNQLQIRFAPHLERYRNFMAEDPVVPSENARQTQAMLSRVSEVLHYLGHAYHSLSDIIVRVRTPPPRPLLCRPILIQRSAVLQAGIPIQVEVAQINLSAATERPRTTDTANAGATENSSANATNGTASGSNSNSSNSEDTTPSAPPPPQMSQQQNQPTVNFRTFPLIPGASMRVQSFPIEVRASTRPAGNNGANNGGNGAGVTFRSSSSLLSAQNNGNSDASPTAAAGGTTAPASVPNNASNGAGTGTAAGTGGGAENNTAAFSIPNFNNSSVEVFMEVTPEVLQGTMNGPPPEFLQSLIQMAGQIMDRVTTTAAGASTTSSDGTNNTNGNNATSTSADGSQPNVTSQTIPGQNSQARGNTQTNPTTATHTRSTPRPHVHLAQQAMQGGFDPFLPCNSHHVTHHNGHGGSSRRRGAAQNGNTQASSQNNGAEQGQQQGSNSSSRQGQTNSTRGQHQRSFAQRITTPWDLQTFISNLPQNSRGASAANNYSAQGSTQPRSNDTSDSQHQQNRSNTTNAGSNNASPRTGIFNVVDQIMNDVRAALGRPRATSQDGGDSEDGDTRTTPRDSSRRSNVGASRRTTESGSGNAVTVDDVGSDPEADGSFGSFPAFQVALDSIPNVLQGPTIAEILQQLPPDDSGSTPRPGESIITDLIMLLSRNLTIVDMIALNSGNFEPLNKVANEMQTFFMTRILDGSTSAEAVNTGVDRIVNEMQPFLENFSRLRIRDDINMVRSVECLFRRRLPDIITTAANLNAANSRAANMRNLVNKCVTLTKMICTLALNASENGQQGVEETFRQIVASYMEGIPVELQTWTMMTSCANLRHFMSGMDVPASDIQQYIVRNSDATTQAAAAAAPSEAAAAATTTTTTTTKPTPDVAMTTPKPPTTERENLRKEESKTATAAPAPATSSNSEPMDLDEPEFTSSSVLASTALGTVEDAEVLPNVVLGSESWHDQVPQDWVPIITRDVQRQRRQSPQGPFSDAYLSSMPTKRRRIVASSKPQGSLPQVISESVRHAVTSTGLQTVAPLDAVSQAAGDSVELQTAYRNLLRSTVQTALRDNEDFTPDRFPNAATYFKPQQ